MTLIWVWGKKKSHNLQGSSRARRVHGCPATLVLPVDVQQRGERTKSLANEEGRKEERKKKRKKKKIRKKRKKKKKFSPSFGISGLFFLVNTLRASFSFKNFVGRRRVGSENNGKNPSII